jgi:nucleotide-binding universal stress UspA family protein
MKALIALDGSPESSLALDVAAGLSWPAGSKIEVLTALPTKLELYGGPWAGFAHTILDDDLRERLQHEAEQILDAAAEHLGTSHLDIALSHPVGRAASVIVERADRVAADLIILGARGHGALERAVLGSVSSEVVDRAHCAVLVARNPTTRRILIGTDGSDAAMSALSFVSRSGLFDDAKLRIVHAIDLPTAWWLGFSPEDASFASDAYVSTLAEGRRRATDVTNRAWEALEAVGMNASACVVEGDAAAAINREAASWHADLVIVGTRGHGLVKRLLLGSTARSVLHGSASSVLITRGTIPVGDAATSPVTPAFAAPSYA